MKVLSEIANDFKEKALQEYEIFKENRKKEWWENIFVAYKSFHVEERDVEARLEDRSDFSPKIKVKNNPHLVDIHSLKPSINRHLNKCFRFQITKEDAEDYGWTGSLQDHCHQLFKKMDKIKSKEASVVFDNILIDDRFQKIHSDGNFLRGDFDKILSFLSSDKNLLKPNFIVCHPNLLFKFYKQLSKDYLDFIDCKIIVNHHLIDPSAWFVITDAAHGFKCFERQKPELRVFAQEKSEDDFNFKPVINFYMKERYSFCCSNNAAFFCFRPYVVNESLLGPTIPNSALSWKYQNSNLC